MKTTIYNVQESNFEQWIKVHLDCLKEGFVFALMKCSSAAFGEQNKTDNDSKCQQAYKSFY